MQKKIIALAIAAAISAPAFADNANVTVYGKAFLTFDQMSTDKAGASSQQRVNTNASRFGVKGSEDLGDGLKGIYQFEVEMDADGSGNSVTTTATGTGTPAAATYTSTPTPSGMGKSRNSGLGLEGSFGKVILGIWDTPFKVAHNKIELFDNTTSWSAIKVIGFNAGTDYNTRQKNMIQYWSPKMGGFQVAAMYSPDEAQTTTANKNIVSLSGTYDQDDIYVAAAYERRNDATTTGKADTATRVVGRYSLGDFWLGAMAEQMTKESTSTINANNSEFVAGVKLGAGSLAASYAQAGSYATGAAAANDVNQISVKYDYNLSKRTEAFVAYTSNKANGATSVATQYTGVGLLHSF